jgi:hypothetical protein
MRYYFEESVRKKRQLHLPPMMRLIFQVRGIFISRQRREAFQKMAGYAILEPKGKS